MKYRNIGLRLLVLSLLIAFSSHGLFASGNDSLFNYLSTLPGVKSVKEMPVKGYSAKYEVLFEQPVDHSNPSVGKFLQRVFIMHRSAQRPTVIVTEGYGGAYAQRSSYKEELSVLLDANVVFVEHRYFLESTPKGFGWGYLTGKNAAADLHNINMMLRPFYQGKWIATGISKGGQNALIYTAFYPNNMDVTVPYVAPLCKGVEDGRHEPFIKKFVGTKGQRDSIENFQKEILFRRGSLQPLFDSLCTAQKMEFNIPFEEVYDYSVLELSFSLWQWGTPISQIPSLKASDKEVFDFWMRYCSPDYFVNNSPTASFFVQAAAELGYYGYDIKPFKRLLKIKSAKNYLHKIFLPEDATGIKFDKSLYNRLKKFVDTTSNRMMFIYGEYDPWSAVMVHEPKGENVVVFVDPKGSHRARINTLPNERREQALELLKSWLK